MIYTVEEHGSSGVKKQTYEGFRRYLGGNAKTIASVMSPDGLDLWIIDDNNPLASDELRRYYRASWNIEVEVFLFKGTL